MMQRIPSFSVILCFVVLSIVGLFSLPMQKVQYEPTVHSKSMSIGFSWPGVSPLMLEREVTSVIEGLVASLPGVENITSYSGKGGGNVYFDLKKNADPEMVRFELSTMLRRYADKLPEGVSHPYISGSSAGGQEKPILSYTVIADLPSQMIAQFTEERLISKISLIEGVHNVKLTGVNRYFRRIVFDPERLEVLGVDVRDVENVIATALGEDRIVGAKDGKGVLLAMDTDISSLPDMPVRKVGDRILRLSDIAEITFEEKEPDSYFRINGNNTINMTVYAGQNVNVIALADRVKDVVKCESSSFPETYTVSVAMDDSVELRHELKKIYIRTGLSLLILLLFVFVSSGSLKYLFVIFTALAVNLMTALFFYAIFGIHIQIYSLAGITVSFGIMIDASIIMVSHYCYYRNRKAFHAILAAQLTTIGALCVVFLLPEGIRMRLSDFAAVVIVNLSVSLLVAVLLIPALSDAVGLQENRKSVSIRQRRRTVRFNACYEKYIVKGKRFGWLAILLVILSFGLPVSKLPKSVGKEPYGVWERAYNFVFGSEFFQNKLKEPLNKVLGGSLRLFLERTDMYFGREQSRPSIVIYAILPDGCTVGQMNEVVRGMEEYLSGYMDYIEKFETRISSASDAVIKVEFPEEAVSTGYPFMIKQNVISKALQLGGASWRIYGLDKNVFSNTVYGVYRSDGISISGYNLDRLYEYARATVAHLSDNPRFSSPIISASPYNNSQISEIFMDFDFERMADIGVSPEIAFGKINRMSYSGAVGSYYDERGSKIPVVIESSRRKGYDVWNLANEYISDGDSQFKFSGFGTMSKRDAASWIYKKDQQYTLMIRYDFIGSSKAADNMRNKEIERLNEEVLPVGYKAFSDNSGFFWGDESLPVVWLLILVVSIIFLITGVMFESLRIPLAVIGLIPASFVGLFLTFALFKIPFDIGGMASMVMLTGLVVNAAFYLLNEYHRQLSRHGMTSVKAYIRAFNHKIVPISLTVLSTFLGLVPFLMDGASESFWFPFAIGTMGGLLFSLPALMLLFPMWLKFSKIR